MASTAGCTYDMQCKGSRVCTGGRCVALSSTAGQATTAAVGGGRSPGRGVTCDDDNAQACYELGMRAVFGAQGPDDKGQARAYFHKACRMGHVFACSNLGLLLEDNSSQRQGEPRNCLVHDISSYEKACASGHSEACYKAARLFEGKLLYRIPRDEAKAAELYEQACELGHDEACKAAAR
ncbi:MAG: sel1 repeat family protein [Deltaproteobacteria bacterium]|jgi:TPR repeat protein|nr:sel1 repeat family protein [Deltaproteobacteria bacterium]